MANFIDELAYGSRETWRDQFDKGPPKVGPDGFLTGPWGDAIVAAVAAEKKGDAARRFSDMPAGQVVDYMLSNPAFKKYQKAADATEQAAHAGKLRPPAGPPTGPPVAAARPAAVPMARILPVCQYGPKCYRKNPEHLREFAHPWADGGAGGGAYAGGFTGGAPSAPPAAASPASAQQPIQVRCGQARCGSTFGIAAPPGTGPGATIRGNCPRCGTANEARVPGSAGGHHASGPPVQTRPAPRVGGAPPKLSGRKRALLVGVNYFGTGAELRGCINDVHNIKKLLTGTYGWRDNEIRTLTDDGRGGGMPTRSDIQNCMRWLAEGTQPGDVLFFHFSGHGAQNEDPHGYEEDGCYE